MEERGNYPLPNLVVLKSITCLDLYVDEVDGGVAIDNGYLPSLNPCAMLITFEGMAYPTLRVA